MSSIAVGTLSGVTRRDRDPRAGPTTGRLTAARTLHIRLTHDAGGAERRKPPWTVPTPPQR